jgi:hypothetical protein
MPTQPHGRDARAAVAAIFQSIRIGPTPFGSQTWCDLDSATALHQFGLVPWRYDRRRTPNADGSSDHGGQDLESRQRGVSRNDGKQSMKQYMVIETIRPGCKSRVYERFYSRGRMLPDNLKYIDSWLEHNGERCFQLMETNEPATFDKWIENWHDLVSFEIVEIGPKPLPKEAALHA